MKVQYPDHFERYRSSFSWNNNEENILYYIEKNRVIKKIRDSIAEKQIEKRRNI